MNVHLKARSLLLATASIALFASSCSVVVGNVKPVDEKSTNYGVMDLSTTHSDWIKLDPQKTAEQDEGKGQSISQTEVSDVAFQSKSTASIISLDSACRHSNESSERDLKTLSNLLFLGITDVTLREEKGIEVQKTPALETTLRGKLNSEPMSFKTVVLRRQSCVYDLVYMARPRFFDSQVDDFSHFVASLRLKE